MNKSRSKFLSAVVASVAALGCSISHQANATLLTFDDMAAYAAPVNGYGGLNWNNFYTIPGATYPNSGYASGTVSPGNTLYNADAAPAAVSDGKFDLNSAYLTAAWNDGLQVRAVGKLSGSTVYDNIFTLSATAATLVNFGYLGIDEVIFNPFGGSPHAAYANFGAGTYFAMDNITVNAPPTDRPLPVVPEPSTYAAGAMLVLALGVHGLRSLRRRQPAT